MISPKVIDIKNNRIETDDFLGRKDTKKLYEKWWVSDRGEYSETSRFPTQLFTNINEDKYKYIKII